MAKRRPALISIGNVLRELGHVYRAADRGAMLWTDAAAAARILREIRQCLEASDFEARLARLEAAAEDHEPGWPPAAGEQRVEH